MQSNFTKYFTIQVGLFRIKTKPDSLYFHIVRCSKCGKQSQRNSTFYELDLNIQGNTNLSQCIKEFLKVDKMFIL